jgi:hypothetical protein
MLKPLTIVMLTMLLFAGAVHAGDKASDARLDGVAQRGAQVMPFDLEQTVHIFFKTEKGGVQQVVAKEETNAEQIRLVRTHLSEIARKFLKGDFSDPARIHGEDMPGLAELRKAQPGRIKIGYQELANGGQIDYSSDDPGLVQAIHQWFDTQLRDHARHAIPGHAPHPAHSQ